MFLKLSHAHFQTLSRCLESSELVLADGFSKTHVKMKVCVTTPRQSPLTKCDEVGQGASACAPVLLRLGGFGLVAAILSYFFQNLTCVCRAGCESLQQPGVGIYLKPLVRP